MPARPGGTAIGMLNPAEPLEGSTCTEADCTLEEIPAELDADGLSDDLGVFLTGAASVDFIILLLAETMEELAVSVKGDVDTDALLEEPDGWIIPVEAGSALISDAPKAIKIRPKNNRLLECLSIFFPH